MGGGGVQRLIPADMGEGRGLPGQVATANLKSPINTYSGGQGEL